MEMAHLFWSRLMKRVLSGSVSVRLMLGNWRSALGREQTHTDAGFRPEAAIGAHFGCLFRRALIRVASQFAYFGNKRAR